MKIETVEIDKLKPFERNPKKHPESQLKKLEKSISEFGWTNPILATKDGMVVAGHARLEAAKRLNIGKVPVIYLDMPYEKAIAYVIADNRLAELAETDTAQLSALLGELSVLPDFDIELTGFDVEESATFIQKREQHDAIYKTGSCHRGNNIEFITDETAALAADDDAKERFKDKSNILMAFSGGKDSSFALLWAKTNFPDKRIICIFADSGVEFPGITAHVKTCADFFEVECKIVKPEKDMWIEIEKDGWFPNIIFHSCQHDFIYTPINKYELEFDPIESIILDGSRGDQSSRTTKKSKTSGSADPKMKEYDYYHPTFDISRDLQESILVKSGMPIWEGYSRGFQRTACWMCPGQNSDQALALSENYPGLVEDIRRWEKKLGKKLVETNNRSIDDLIKTGLKNRERRAKKAAD